MQPEPIKRFAEIFSKLPSIGPRQAQRLAFYIVTLGKAKIREMAESLDDLGKMKTCQNCFSVYFPTPANAENLCNICLDKKRDKGIIAIVEKETDLLSLERTHKYNGRYLVIGDLQKSGSLESEQKLRLNALKKFIEKELGGTAEEIIIAINPTTYGDLNAGMLAKELKDFTHKITRLGRGIPTGGEIEFADEDTLKSAIERRI
ncbi:MAG: toprim domain-containing protein [Candidatus Pacebacteria bacterium]|nr:toprim domain-containing protein [Candidatus Paceibacterota bacterium]